MEKARGEGGRETEETLIWGGYSSADGRHRLMTMGSEPKPAFLTPAFELVRVPAYSAHDCHAL